MSRKLWDYQRVQGADRVLDFLQKNDLTPQNAFVIYEGVEQTERRPDTPQWRGPLQRVYGIFHFTVEDKSEG